MRQQVNYREFLSQADQPVSTLYLPLTFLPSSIKTWTWCNGRSRHCWQRGIHWDATLLGSESEAVENIVASSFRYTQAAFSQVAQNAVCYLLHRLNTLCPLHSDHTGPRWRVHSPHWRALASSSDDSVPATGNLTSVPPSACFPALLNVLPRSCRDRTNDVPLL
jgi:hypothetical protein